MGVLILNDMPLEIPVAQLRLSMKMQQRSWASKQLHLRRPSSCIQGPTRMESATKEISPQDCCVDGFRLPGCGDGCSICELPFRKAGWQGQSPPLQASYRGCDFPCTLLMSSILKLFWLHVELRGLGSTTWQARDALKCSTSPASSLKSVVSRRKSEMEGWRDNSNNGLERVN